MIKLIEFNFFIFHIWTSLFHEILFIREEMPEIESNKEFVHNL
jgi:hypothetical protein